MFSKAQIRTMYVDMDGTAEIELTFMDGFVGTVYKADVGEDDILCYPSDEVCEHFGDIKGAHTFLPFEELKSYKLIRKEGQS